MDPILHLAQSGTKCSMAQLSLLISDRHSRHFHYQCPHSVSSKCTCCHPNTHGRVGLKMRCGQAHYWRIAILRQQKAIVPLANKNLV